jgi:hypothetical protein
MMPKRGVSCPGTSDTSSAPTMGVERLQVQGAGAVWACTRDPLVAKKATLAAAASRHPEIPIDTILADLRMGDPP